MRAAQRGAYATAQALVDARADLEAVDKDGLSALAVAMIHRQTRVGRLLLRAGATPCAPPPGSALAALLPEL